MTNIKEIILAKLEEQRHYLLSINANLLLITKEKLEEYYSSMVFEEDNIVERMIEEFCTIEDIMCINELTDYQHETVEKCINLLKTK